MKIQKPVTKLIFISPNFTKFIIINNFLCIFNLHKVNKRINIYSAQLHSNCHLKKNAHFNKNMVVHE